MGPWNRRQEMGWAAVIMGVSVLLSRFMGLIRDKIISYLFGATRETDLYFAAFVVPDFINYLLAGAYFSITLIPLLAEHFHKDEEEGWRFLSTVLTWIFLTAAALTLVAMILAPQLAFFAAPGLDDAALRRLARFLRIVLPAQVCFLLGSCFMAVLYLRKQFLLPALVPLVYNSMIILGGVILRRRGMEGFCWGVLTGAFLGNFLLPLWAVNKEGGVKFRPRLTHSGLKGFLLLALPLMLGQSIVVLDEQFTRIFASLAGIGAISWLNYGRRIMMVPVGVVAQAAGVASYPFLADLVARKEFPKFHETLNRALLNVCVLLLPLSFWMITVSEPIIVLIFQQGKFGAADSVQTTRVLQILLLAVLFWGGQQIVARGYYARQDTLTPAVLGTVTSLVSVPVFYLAGLHYGAPGVAGASGVSVILYTLLLSGWWGRRFGWATFRGLQAALGKTFLVALVCCGPSYWIVRWQFIRDAAHPYLWALGTIGVTALVYGGTFLVLGRLLLGTLLDPFLEKAGPLGRRLLR
ncbi:MAG TPA: murein biosynthesis integral membrane protein MurJ [Syntrophobacteraceae bacterium]|nr:murein biosynthesis integral membrane protein MurJ [Syntrophobacteraceae bacterium]